MTRIALMLMVFISPALAQSDNSLLEKTCILAAAEKLPNIPGMTILASRTKPRARASKSEPAVTDVEIDVKAAGLDATYTFLCTPQGKDVFVLRIGVTR